MTKYILEDNEYHDSYHVELTEEQVRLLKFLEDNDLICNGFKITEIDPDCYKKV